MQRTPGREGFPTYEQFCTVPENIFRNSELTRMNGMTLLNVIDRRSESYVIRRKKEKMVLVPAIVYFILVKFPSVPCISPLLVFFLSCRSHSSSLSCLVAQKGVER
jgi:hypothetical protein